MKKKLFMIICLLIFLFIPSLVLISQDGRDVIVLPNGQEEYRSERIAIVVGVNDYADMNLTLQYAVPDAELMKEVLEKEGYFDVRLIKDRNATRGRILDEIESVKTLSDLGLVKKFIFYFAGHGFKRSDKNYLAPFEFQVDNMENTGVSIDKVVDIVKSIGNKSNALMFLDACRNDPDPKSSRDLSGGTFSDVDSKGVAIFFSAKDNTKSFEDKDFQHGVYTYYLVKGLRGEADLKPVGNEDGFVSFLEVVKYVSLKMAEWSKNNKYNKKQEPRFTILEGYGEFLITKTGESKPNPINLNLKYIDMVKVDGGTFKQNGIERYYEDGQLKEKYVEGFSHTVSSFYMGKYEVTYELWYTVYQWALKNGYSFANKGAEGIDWENQGKSPSGKKYEPVTMVSWRDCVVWCNAYSELVGLSPSYKTIGGKVLKDSSNAICDWSSDGYRLPTEGEWQYAASNKGKTPYDYASGASANYKDSSANSKVAWYWENSDNSTHTVGTKVSNGLDLYDMSGNVWEWCWDWKDKHPTSSSSDYRGPTTGSGRVLRGGGWDSNAYILRVGYRAGYEPGGVYNDLGFRVGRLVP